MESKKEEIKMRMFENNISYQELADRLHLPKHRLYYNLNASSDIPLELYINIMNILECKTEKVSKCYDTLKSNFTTNTILASAIRDINEIVMNSVSDGVLDSLESITIKSKLEEIREKLNTTIENWIKKL